MVRGLPRRLRIGRCGLTRDLLSSSEVARHPLREDSRSAFSGERPVSPRIGFKVRGWDVELYADWRCLMLGVNWEWNALRACYLHVGPVILGAHQWKEEIEPPPFGFLHFHDG